MKTSYFCSANLVACFVCVFLLGQTVPSFAQGDSQSVQGKRRPTLATDAYYPYVVGEGLHQRDPRILIYVDSDFKVQRIFHRPILMFENNPNPIEGYPPAVWKAGPSPLDNNLTRLDFRVSLMTDRTEAHVRDAFYDSAFGQTHMKTVWNKESPDRSFNSSDYAVELNAIDEIMIRCVRQGDILSQYKSPESRSTSGKMMSFHLDFTASKLKSFLEGTMNGNDDVLFVSIISSYTGVTAEARKNITGSIDTVKSIESALGSRQFDPNKPIFQEERNAAIEEINGRITTTMYMTDPKLFIMLDSHDGVSSSIFKREPISWDELRSDPQLLARFHEYIRPHIQTAAETTGYTLLAVREDGTTIDLTKIDSVSQTRSKTKGYTVGAKVGTEGVGVNGAYSQSTTDSTTKTKAEQEAEAEYSKVMNQHGVNWQKSETGTHYIPHQIAVYKFQEGKETINLNENFNVFLQLDNAYEVTADSGTPISLTPQTFEKEMPKSSDVPGYEGNPIGTVLFFLGNTPPPGWVWFNADNFFPNTAHFPKSLGGTQMPDTDKAVFMGTARDVSKVGHIHQGEEVTHHAKVEGHDIAAKLATITKKMVLVAPNITSGNIAASLEASIGRALRSNENYIAERYRDNPQAMRENRPMWEYRRAVLSVFCNWQDTEYWNNKAYWDKPANRNVGARHNFNSREYRSTAIKTDSAYWNNLPDSQKFQSSRVSDSEHGGNRTIYGQEQVILSTIKSTGGKEYTYAEVINDPAKMIEVMSHHWRLHNPGGGVGDGYFKVASTALNPDTTVTVPAINVPGHNAPVVIDMDAEENRPSYIQGRWIIRVR